MIRNHTVHGRTWGFLLACAFVFSLLGHLSASTEAERDPNRTPCSSKSCKKVERFLRSHYCGKSPFGNGPSDGCEIRALQKPQPKVRVDAGYHCQWNEQKQSDECRKSGRTSDSISGALRSELRRLGLRAKDEKSIKYRVWTSNSDGWMLASASYTEARGSDLVICQVIGLFGKGSTLHVVREVRCQKTDADVPTVTTWSPIDIADVNGDGHSEIVFEADAYEDHWFEVVSVGDDLSSQTIFRGLGYYL